MGAGPANKKGGVIMAKKNAKATKKVAKNTAVKATKATTDAKVAEAPEREPLHEVFGCVKLETREEVVKIQRAVRRIFTAGEQSRTQKLGLKIYEYSGLRLLQQNPNTRFAREKLIPRGINPLRVFWILKDSDFIGVALFVGTVKSYLFAFPKEGKFEEIVSVLKED